MIQTFTELLLAKSLAKCGTWSTFLFASQGFWILIFDNLFSGISLFFCSALPEANIAAESSWLEDDPFAWEGVFAGAVQ